MVDPAWGIWGTCPTLPPGSVKVKAYFWSFTTLTKVEDWSTGHIGVPPPCNPTRLVVVRVFPRCRYRYPGCRPMYVYVEKKRFVCRLKGIVMPLHKH